MNTKSILRSKTFWVQVAALVAMIFPQARDFFSNNPVEVMAVIAAVNVIVRFATKGGVTLISSGDEESPGSGSGWMPLLVAMGGLAAFATALPAPMGV